VFKYKLEYCYRTFPILVWACGFPSAQQACRSFFRVIYAKGPLKGPQSTTTADILTLSSGFLFIYLWQFTFGLHVRLL
jgi:hypothetical protein